MKPYSSLLVLCLTLLVFLTAGFSAGPTTNSLSKASTLEFDLYDRNQIRNWMGNNGHIVSHIPTGDAGLEWPNGSGNTAVFCSGIWVTGRVDGNIRSAAAEFTTEWAPGVIPYDTGTQQPTSNAPINTADHQVYMVNRNDSADPSAEMYNREYATWPSSDGAPAHDGEYFLDLDGDGLRDEDEDYEDFNLDGIYNGPDGTFVTGEDPPDFFGSDMAWYVSNDWSPNTHANLWSTPPLGLELQVLINTINTDLQLGNVQFHTVTLVNKSGQQIDDAHYAYWCDADVGDAIDDFTGCDPEASLGYFYNGTANDEDYGLTPPAVGYTVLQGAMVPSTGDTVKYRGQVFPDRKTLGMTSFVKYTSSDPDHGDPESAIQAFNFMQGLRWNGESYHEYFDPSQPETRFQYSGSPETGEGWTEYDDSTPGDRRALMGSGPFVLEPWDDLNDNGKPEFGEPGVQIIHTALVIAAGTNNLNAITSMKYFSGYARSVFETAFQVGEPTAVPRLSGSGYDQEIILNWYEGSETYEASSVGGYEFEGYELYQGASSEGPWTRIMGFDVVNDVGAIVEEYVDENGLIQQMITHAGNNDGLEHIVYITEDALMGGAALINGEDYHFALSPYLYDGDATPNAIEGPLQVVTIRPTQESGGFVPRDLVDVYHEGAAQARLSVEVLDPSHLSGGDYEVGFGFDSTDMEGDWYLLKDLDGVVDTLRYGDRWGGQYYQDGFELSIEDIIFDAPRLNSFWEQTENIQGNYEETMELLAVSPGGVDSLAWTDASMTSMVHLDTLYGPSYPWDYFILEDRGLETWFILHREITHEIMIQGFASVFGGIGGDRLADIPGIGGGSNEIEELQSDLEIRFTESGQTASLWNRDEDYVPRPITIPFEVWDIERDMQLCVAIFDHNKTGGIQDTLRDDMLDLDWVTVMYADYATHADSLFELLNNPRSGWSWHFNRNSVFSVGDVVQLNFVNPVVPGVDTYSWTTSSVDVDEPNMPDDHELGPLLVYPNPFNPATLLAYDLPENSAVSLIVYDIQGREVAQLVSGSQTAGKYEIQWRGLDSQGRQVATGLYLARLQAGEHSRVVKMMYLK